MSSTVLVLLILLCIALGGVFVVGLVLGILKLVEKLGGGGFAVLHDRFASPEMPIDQVMAQQTVKIGAVVYKRCMKIGIFSDGLYLARGSKLHLNKPKSCNRYPLRARHVEDKRVH